MGSCVLTLEELTSTKSHNAAQSQAQIMESLVLDYNSIRHFVNQRCIM